MALKKALKGSLDVSDCFETLEWKRSFAKNHPDYFPVDGLLMFCGPQGSGKTLSAVKYVSTLMKKYPKAILVSNVDIKGVKYIPYDGIDSLFNVSNGENGVIYLIDEIHLEFNSLESRNISIEEMTEFSQQRKQRKHIVGTSQVYMRLAKPCREQIRDVVLCSNIGGVLQHNVLIDGLTSTENNGKFFGKVVKNFWWFHTPKLYECYDTYAKMQRYKKEWCGHARGLPTAQYSGISGEPGRSSTPNGFPGVGVRGHKDR